MKIGTIGEHKAGQCDMVMWTAGQLCNITAVAVRQRSSCVFVDWADIMTWQSSPHNTDHAQPANIIDSSWSNSTFVIVYTFDALTLLQSKKAVL